MPQQPEPGEVGAGRGLVLGEDLRAAPVRQHHRVQRRLDPPPLGAQLVARGKQGARADGLGQQQHIARLHAALAHQAAHRFVDQAVHRKTQCQFAAFAGVPAHQRAFGFVQHLHRAGHHLQQQVFDLGFKARWHGGHGCGGLGFTPHGEDVAQRVVRRHPAEDIRVIDEGTEEVHGVHHGLARGHPHHGGVVRRVQADQHFVAVHGYQRPQRARQHGGADLRAATATAHGDGGNGLLRFFARKRHLRSCGRAGRAVRVHRRKLAELAHEAAVDPVLPAPDPFALEADEPTRGHRMLVAGADQGQPAALRPVGLEGLAQHTAAQVVGQRTAHAHGEDARLFRAAGR